VPNSNKFGPAVALQKATKDSNVEFTEFSRAEDREKSALLKTFLNARKQLQLMQQDMNSQGRRSLFLSEGRGDGGGGLENERCLRKFVEGSRGILPPEKHFKSRGSEMVF